MSWVKEAIEKLQAGESAQIRPHGHSMRGRVNYLDLVTLEPCDSTELQVDDIVFVRINGNVLLHLIKEIEEQDNQRRFLIGNNIGKINGWVDGTAIYGVATKVESGNVE